MKKVLFVATIHKHFRAFHIPYMKWFKENAWKVDVMAGGDDVDFDCVDNKFHIDIQRTPFNIKNLKAYCQAKKVIKNGNYDLVYCHTAMGAVVARLAARKTRKYGQTKVIYVAHGFHFFKGSPWIYWLTYFPIEKFLSQFSDAIVTINNEDYQLVKNHGFKNANTFKINGIGVNSSRFFVATPEQKSLLRAKNSIPDNAFVLIYIAEFIRRKNHKFIIDTLPELTKIIPELKVLFAGRGLLMEQMKAYAQRQGVKDHIVFFGFRNDIPELVALSDVGISASRQEGLGLNLIEEMFGGLPVVATTDRGHKEIIINGYNGFLFAQNNENEFIEKLSLLYNNPSLRSEMAMNATESVKKFELDKAVKALSEIFNKICN